MCAYKRMNMETKRFIEILNTKIKEANNNIFEINQFRMVDRRAFGYTANYYDDKHRNSLK